VPKFIDKAHERGADCALVDLEDSVPPAWKAEARAVLPETMKKVVRGGADVAVRINRPLRRAMPDIEAAVRPGLKACSSPRPKAGSVGFAAMIEHPRAFTELHDIAARGPRVIAMMLGGEDFCPRDRLGSGRRDARAAQAHGGVRRLGARRFHDRHPGYGG